MSASITTDTNTSLIFLNTATTVILDEAAQGQLITIRDSTGFASSANEITITTVNNSNFNTGLPNITNTITIRQPFGFATVQYDSTTGWGILNTFGLEEENTTTPFQELAVNTIFFNDQAGGPQSQLNVSNSTLLLNGVPIEAGGGGGGTIPNPLNAVTINASNINVSSNTTVNGTVTTKFLTFNNIGGGTSQISSQSNILYRGNYQINPIGGYIEFKFYESSMEAYTRLSTYPLYVGELINITNGWWPTDNSRISGFITFPGFSLVTWSNAEYSGTIIHSNTNTGTMPLYSNINPVVFLNGSYKLSPIS